MTCSMAPSGKDSVQLQGTLKESLGRVETSKCSECSQGYGNGMRWSKEISGRGEEERNQ